jgi:hypothetical protein
MASRMCYWHLQHPGLLLLENLPRCQLCTQRHPETLQQWQQLQLQQQQVQRFSNRGQLCTWQQGPMSGRPWQQHSSTRWLPTSSRQWML